jgi:hypothetical protein
MSAFGRVFCLGLVASCASDAIEVGSAESALDLDAFVLPELTAAERAAIVHRYDALDPTDAIPRGLLEDAIVYLDVNRAHIPKTQYMVVVDLSLFSGMDRFWLLDLTTGAVEAHKVAHGDGSDPDNDGFATLFGNVEGSHMSSLGFYLTGEIYNGTHVHSMKLDGLSVDASPNGMANTNVRDRLIVVHEATYVDDANPDQQGRSNGCLALDPSIEVGVVDKIHDGSLIYTATSELAPPVGRTPAPEDPPEDPPADDPGAGENASGCSTGGGAGLMLGLALAGLRRRRR